jgi:hypothetical protein
VFDYLQAAGIRVRLRPIKRAAFIKGYAEKLSKNFIQGGNEDFTIKRA